MEASEDALDLLAGVAIVWVMRPEGRDKSEDAA